MSLLIWILVQWKWEVWSCTRRKCGRNWDECSEITEEEGQRQSETLSQYYIEQECESKELFEKVERMDWVKEFRNIWLMDPLAPIWFFTTVFILDDLRHFICGFYWFHMKSTLFHMKEQEKVKNLTSISCSYWFQVDFMKSATFHRICWISVWNLLDSV